MKKIIIANWKMQKTFLQAKDWAKKHKEELEVLAQNNADKIIAICPSFESLDALNKIFLNSGIFIGAQNCAPFLTGAYTGQVSPESLKEIGCTYCIIGHSETRKYQNAKDSDIGVRAKLLLDNNIIPVICIGETLDENQNNRTQEILKDQLTVIFENINNWKNSSLDQVIIAYEPVWAIGTGVTPKAPEIQSTINFIKDVIQEYKNSKFISIRSYPSTTLPAVAKLWRAGRMIGQVNAPIEFKVIYGGSVNPDNIIEFKKIENIDGFLLGNSGLDFQVLKKIVSL